MPEYQFTCAVCGKDVSVPPPEQIRVESRLLTLEERVYCDVASDIVKRQLPYVNELLKSLLTLSVALLAGALGFLKEGQIHNCFRLPLLLMLLAAAIVALVGMLPKHGQLALNVPREIKRQVNESLAAKDKWLWASALLLLASLAMAIVGIMLA